MTARVKCEKRPVRVACDAWMGQHSRRKVCQPLEHTLYGEAVALRNAASTQPRKR
jgi:hypothetical protein